MNRGRCASTLLAVNALRSYRLRLPSTAVVVGAGVVAGEEDREDVRGVRQQQRDDGALVEEEAARLWLT